MGTAGAGPGHQTVPAVVAGLVDIEEGHDVAERQRPAEGVGDLPVHRHQPPDIDMPGDQGIGYPAELTMLQMHIRAADLGIQRLQQRRARFEDRVGEAADLDGLVGGRDDSGTDGHWESS